MDVALENRRLHRELLDTRGNSLHLIQADGLAPVSESFRPELIVSNPPYIPSETIGELEPEVAQHEPRMALDGGMDGLNAHRYLAKAAAHMLPQGGIILTEIGHDQAEAVRDILSAQADLEFRAIRQDIAGRARVAVARRGHAARARPAPPG